MTENIDTKDMNVESFLNLKSFDLGEKLNSKKSLLQFQPKCLKHLNMKKTIEYKGVDIKTSYIFDIVNNLILKYYFRKENKYTLNATVLKDRYGFKYKLYIDWLIENDIISMIYNYKAGHNSRVYSLNKLIFKSEISRFKNKDSVLLKKYKKKVFDTIDLSNDTGLIDIHVKEKLVSDLFNVDIDLDRSIFFLNSLKCKDIDIYNRNLYAIDSINDGHIFYHFDSYGRMHTNFTILRSFIRKNCLLIDGEETFEIDIDNSQPLFLSKLINDSNTKWVTDEEFVLFKELTRNGNYYEYLMQNLGISDKNKAKELTYKVLFGRNSSNSKSDKLFKSIFPSIHRFITLYKKEYKNYKILAYDLQKMESNLIFNKIINKVITQNPDIKLITVHDSIIIQKKYKEQVYAIFKSQIIKEFDF
jgi:hypothetical protein